MAVVTETSGATLVIAAGIIMGIVIMTVIVVGVVLVVFSLDRLIGIIAHIMAEHSLLGNSVAIPVGKDCIFIVIAVVGCILGLVGIVEVACCIIVVAIARIVVVIVSFGVLLLSFSFC